MLTERQTDRQTQVKTYTALGSKNFSLFLTISLHIYADLAGKLANDGAEMTQSSLITPLRGASISSSVASQSRIT